MALIAAALLGGCSSAAAPGSETVLNQVDKAKQAQEQAEARNAELDNVCTDPATC